jgi:DNA-binding HxlR family transcriptional regulator
METETITENQKVSTAKKIKKMFGGIDPKNPPEYCPIRDVMALASDKWSILIILYLGYYPVLRFNEIKKKVYGISSKVLSERLKLLEADGYLTRTLYPEVPVRVEYALTDFGHSYLEKLLDLTQWVQKYSDKVISHRSAYKRR